MIRVILLAFALPALFGQSVRVAQGLPPVAEWVPQDAVLVMEISRPQAFLDPVLDPDVSQQITASAAYQQAASQPGVQQFLAAVSYLEARLGTDWRSGVRKLLGGGLTLAVSADGSVLLAVDAQDEKLLRELYEILLGFARQEAAQQGDPDRVTSRTYHGIVIWSVGDDQQHALIGSRLLMANRAEALQAALDVRANPEAKRLATLAQYQAACRACSAGADARVYVNLQLLKEKTPLGQALQQATNPLAALFLAGVTESLEKSSWLAMQLSVRDGHLSLRSTTDGRATASTGAAAFALPHQPGQGALPNLFVPRRIAALSFYRDLHAFYAAKDTLFPERTSGLIFFENMMGIFFSGMDLTEEVLGETCPEIRFVVAEQTYRPAGGIPRVQLPAFAGIFRLQHPEEFAEIVEEAWQKAIGLVNFTRGQQAQPGLIIDRPTHGNTKFTTAYFRASKDHPSDGIDPRYNFRPAVAVVGEWLILSSTDELVRDLIDALQRQPPVAAKPLENVHSTIELNLAQLASILRANRDNLVRQNMVEKGNTRQQAESQIDLLLGVVEHLSQAKLELGTRAGQSYAQLEVTPEFPKAAR